MCDGVSCSVLRSLSPKALHNKEDEDCHEEEKEEYDVLRSGGRGKRREKNRCDTVLSETVASLQRRASSSGHLLALENEPATIGNTFPLC